MIGIPPTAFVFSTVADNIRVFCHFYCLAPVCSFVLDLLIHTIFCTVDGHHAAAGNIQKCINIVDRHLAINIDGDIS